MQVFQAIFSSVYWMLLLVTTSSIASVFVKHCTQCTRSVNEDKYCYKVDDTVEKKFVTLQKLEDERMRSAFDSVSSSRNLKAERLRPDILQRRAAVAKSVRTYLHVIIVALLLDLFLVLCCIWEWDEP